MTAQASPIPSAYELRMKQANVIRKFFNKMQRQAMAIAAHDEYIVASRGTGKSEGIDARFILRNVWEMPGSLGGMISPSYAKAWGNTLPAICKALAEWGYIQNIHYVVGHKAPPSMALPSLFVRYSETDGVMLSISGMARSWSFFPLIKGCPQTPCRLTG